MTMLILYKCRMCNEIYKNGACGENLVMPIFVSAINNMPCPENKGIPFSMTDLHLCHGDNCEMGISDCIGFIREGAWMGKAILEIGMPETCFTCPLEYDGMYCQVGGDAAYFNEDDTFDPENERAPYCPLKAVQ